MAENYAIPSISLPQTKICPGCIVCAGRICDSSGTAERLKQMVNVHTDAVVRPGLANHFVDQSFESTKLPDALARAGVRQPYLLSVATAEPRKNLISLLDEFVSIRESGQLPDYGLVLAGMSGGKIVCSNGNWTLQEITASSRSDTHRMS